MSRQVRMAAFEALGSFIATFADSKTTGLYLTSDGAVTVCLANGLSPSKWVCAAVFLTGVPSGPEKLEILSFC